MTGGWLGAGDRPKLQMVADTTTPEGPDGATTSPDDTPADATGCGACANGKCTR